MAETGRHDPPCTAGRTRGVRAQLPSGRAVREDLAGRDGAEVCRRSRRAPPPPLVEHPAVPAVPSRAAARRRRPSRCPGSAAAPWRRATSARASKVSRPSLWYTAVRPRADHPVRRGRRLRRLRTPTRARRSARPPRPRSPPIPARTRAGRLANVPPRRCVASAAPHGSGARGQVRGYRRPWFTPQRLALGDSPDCRGVAPSGRTSGRVAAAMWGHHVAIGTWKCGPLRNAACSRWITSEPGCDTSPTVPQSAQCRVRPSSVDSPDCVPPTRRPPQPRRRFLVQTGRPPASSVPLSARDRPDRGRVPSCLRRAALRRRDLWVLCRRSPRVSPTSTLGPGDSPC